MFIITFILTVLAVLAFIVSVAGVVDILFPSPVARKEARVSRAVVRE